MARRDRRAGLHRGTARRRHHGTAALSALGRALSPRPPGPHRHAAGSDSLSGTDSEVPAGRWRYSVTHCRFVR
eukprot:746515-Hanusia_phi.AAC.4